ncbi:hypothetical protein [Streptomyces sp. NPDC004783]|uniref:hypothetical protein n=1 Tax=Streptomyces sp. NPDC004783 TaxID=3154459 RepID=UPI0033A2AF6C
MANLTPTQTAPGLHISKPSPDTPATGSALCHCGASATASGDAQVQRLVQGWQESHGSAHHKGGK